MKKSLFIKRGKFYRNIGKWGLRISHLGIRSSWVSFRNTFQQKEHQESVSVEEGGEEQGEGTLSK